MRIILDRMSGFTPPPPLPVQAGELTSLSIGNDGNPFTPPLPTLSHPYFSRPVSIGPQCPEGYSVLHLSDDATAKLRSYFLKNETEEVGQVSVYCKYSYVKGNGYFDIMFLSDARKTQITLSDIFIGSNDQRREINYYVIQDGEVVDANTSSKALCVVFALLGIKEGEPQVDSIRRDLGLSYRSQTIESKRLISKINELEEVSSVLMRSSREEFSEETFQLVCLLAKIPESKERIAKLFNVEKIISDFYDDLRAKPFWLWGGFNHPLTQPYIAQTIQKLSQAAFLLLNLSPQSKSVRKILELIFSLYKKIEPLSVYDEMSRAAFIPLVAKVGVTPRALSEIKCKDYGFNREIYRSLQGVQSKALKSYVGFCETRSKKQGFFCEGTYGAIKETFGEARADRYVNYFAKSARAISLGHMARATRSVRLAEKTLKKIIDENAEEKSVENTIHMKEWSTLIPLISLSLDLDQSELAIRIATSLVGSLATLEAASLIMSYFIKTGQQDEAYSFYKRYPTQLNRDDLEEIPSPEKFRALQKLEYLRNRVGNSSHKLTETLSSAGVISLSLCVEAALGCGDIIDEDADLFEALERKDILKLAQLCDKYGAHEKLKSVLPQIVGDFETDPSRFKPEELYFMTRRAGERSLSLRVSNVLLRDPHAHLKVIQDIVKKLEDEKVESRI